MPTPPVPPVYRPRTYEPTKTTKAEAPQTTEPPAPNSETEKQAESPAEKAKSSAAPRVFESQQLLETKKQELIEKYPHARQWDRKTLLPVITAMARSEIANRHLSFCGFDAFCQHYRQTQTFPPVTTVTG